MRITNIKRHGENGWTWAVKFSDMPVLIEYRTNEIGEGLWNRVNSMEDAWSQDQGGLQLRLQANTETEAQKAIKRFHTEMEQKDRALRKLLG